MILLSLLPFCRWETEAWIFNYRCYCYLFHMYRVTLLCKKCFTAAFHSVAQSHTANALRRKQLLHFGISALLFISSMPLTSPSLPAEYPRIRAMPRAVTVCLVISPSVAGHQHVFIRGWLEKGDAPWPQQGSSMFRHLEKDCSHGGRCTAGYVCGMQGPGGRLNLPRISDLIHVYANTPNRKH